MEFTWPIGDEHYSIYTAYQIISKYRIAIDYTEQLILKYSVARRRNANVKYIRIFSLINIIFNNF